jgi:hybrid cluster-associated redox disulfide protein
LRQRKEDYPYLIYPYRVNPSGRDESVRSLTIKRLLQEQPQLTRLFIMHRMACPGCEFSRFHSLGQALEIHALPLEPFRSAMQQAAGPNDGQSPLSRSTHPSEEET